MCHSLMQAFGMWTLLALHPPVSWASACATCKGLSVWIGQRLAPSAVSDVWAEWVACAGPACGIWGVC